MRFIVRTYINDGPGRYDAYTPGDRVLIGPELTIDVPRDAVTRNADTPTGFADVAANDVWQIGNRMGQDAHGRSWPSDVPSLSVGDVISIEREHSAWRRVVAVARLGFEPIAWFDLEVSLSDVAVRNRHPFYKADATHAGAAAHEELPA